MILFELILAGMILTSC